MKNIKIVMATDGNEHTVFGRGDDRQKTEEIVRGVVEKVRQHERWDDSELQVQSHERLSDSEFEAESDHSFTFDVTRRTEEPYGDCYYGSQYQPRGHTRARGPVGYSELGGT